MIMAIKTEYDTATDGIKRIFPALCSVGEDIKRSVYEIRLRVGQPVILRCERENLQLQTKVTAQALEQCLTVFCENSVHSSENDLAQGFITLKGGHRAGIAGNAVYSGGSIKTLKNISAVNLRIARQHIGCADRLSRVFLNGIPPEGMIIIGSPLSGKTTILRDLIRCISRKFTVSLIDTRQEIAAAANGEPQLDIGYADVLSGYSKPDGFDIALRTLSPQYIATDELGFDISVLDSCIASGAGIILTAHCRHSDNIFKALDNPDIKKIIACTNISHAVMLDGKNPGSIKGIYNLSELNGESRYA